MLVSSFLFPRYKGNAPANNQNGENTTTTQTQAKPEVTSDIIEEEGDVFTIVIEAPKITGMIDISRQDKANAFIKDNIDKIDKVVADFKATAPKTITDDTKSTLEAGYVLNYFNEKLLSVKMSVSEYASGSAHGNNYVLVINYDIDNSKEIILSDIFTAESNYLNILSTLTAKDLLEKYSEEGKEALDWIKEGTSAKEENFKNFGFNETELTIYFQSYQVGPYSLGEEEVTLPYLDIMTHMKIDGPLGGFII